MVKSAPNCQCDSKTVNIDQVTMYLQVALISILNVKVGNIAQFHKGFRVGRVMRIDANSLLVNHSLTLHLIWLLVITELVKSAPNKNK